VPDLWQILLTALAGFVTGMLSGMFGVGGAIVSTPAIRVLGATPLDAVGSTLPSILPSAVSGSYRYAREGLIRFPVVLWTAVPGVVAVVGGSLLTEVIPGNGHPLMIVTAGLVGFTAIRVAMVLPAPETAPEVILDRRVEGQIHRPADERAPDPADDTPDHRADGRGPRAEPWRLGLVGVGAGGLSGLLGIGGGVVMVPAFVTWVRLPLKEAIGTSLACVGILAVPGMITHALLGHIDWWYALPLCIGVVPGAQLGAHLAIRSSDRTLRIAVAWVLGTIAVVYAAGELIALL
jgi:uncharacterized membrane protein YfcA